METKFTMKQARTYAGLTQSDVAEKMGIDRSTYIRLEKNPDKMTIQRALDFSEITGIPLDRIFFAP